jgi:hypothetical protein
MSNLYRGPSMASSCQDSLHLTKRYQRYGSKLEHGHLWSNFQKLTFWVKLPNFSDFNLLL